MRSSFGRWVPTGPALTNAEEAAACWSGSVADLPGGHAASAAPRRRLCCGDRLPVLVHVVRCGVDPRWASASNGRDRDLSTGGHPRRPGDRRCTCCSAAPRRSGPRHPLDPPGTPSSDRRSGRPVESSSRSPAWRRGNLIIGLVLLGGPIGVLVERSFSTGGSYGLDHYEALGERARQLPAPATTALWNSVVVALAATAIAVLVGLLASLVVVHGRRGVARIFDLGLTLPLGTSAVTIGFGMLIALDEPPLDLRTSWWIIPIAHALVGVPFVVRTMVPVLRSIDPVLHEAAATLGASPSSPAAKSMCPSGCAGCSWALVCLCGLAW